MKEGWVEKRLEDIGIIQTGSTPKTSKKGNFGDFIPFVKPADFKSDGSLNYQNSGLSKSGLATARRVPAGSVMMVCIGATIGKCGFSERDVTTNQQINSLMPAKGVSGKFVYYQMLTDDFQRRVMLSSAQATLPIINKSKWGVLTITFPASLAEQQRIVRILDEAFESIAAAKANAQKNLQNARAVFESELEAVFSQRGAGWEETTLGDEIDLLAGFAFKSAQYTDSDYSVRLLRGDNIIQGSLRWDDVKKWPEADTSEYSHYQLRDGDIVLAMDRPWVKAGLKHAMISEADLPCLLVQRTARLRSGPKVENRFLLYLIRSAKFTHHVLGSQTGIGVPHISGQQIKDFRFLRPSLREQRCIADNLESLHAKTQRLESIYERKLAALEALKKSLLHQAFDGEL